MEIFYNKIIKNLYKANLYWFYDYQHYTYNDQEIWRLYLTIS